MAIHPKRSFTFTHFCGHFLSLSQAMPPQPTAAADLHGSSFVLTYASSTRAFLPSSFLITKSTEKVEEFKEEEEVPTRMPTQLLAATPAR